MTDSLFDVTQLGITAAPETVEPQAYVPAYNENSDPIDAGTYVARLIDGGFKVGKEKAAINIGTVRSSKNNNIYLSAQFAVEVEDAKVKGKNVGKRRVYGRVNMIPEKFLFNKVKPGRENATGFTDLVTTAGWERTLTGPQDHVDALLSLVAKGATLKVSVDKNAYCNPKSNEYAGCGSTIRGEANFVGISNGNGFESIGIRTECTGPHLAERPILLARNEIKRFFPAGKKA